MPTKGRRPKLLTVKDVARLLDTSVRTVWRLVENGRISKPKRLGGAARWFRKDVQVYFWRLMRGDFDEDEKPEP